MPCTVNRLSRRCVDLQLSVLESYLEKLEIQRLLKELRVPDVETLIGEIKHFTEREADKRDKIVLSYFGEKGVKGITDAVVSELLSPPKLKRNAKILDVGAASGFFTVRVANKVSRYMPDASFYAMDITPAMLRVLVRKTSDIVPFLGVAENIAGSVKCARRYLRIPKKFDAIFSTLTLHHCLDIEGVFRSIRGALKARGKAVVVDLCKHPFEEFREEMGDVHLGFDPDWIKVIAGKHFSRVLVEKMPGICCESSGRSAELFIASMSL
jgi:ubiquinone/menaquinone biosynthesis C-methylase UbiE